MKQLNCLIVVLLASFGVNAESEHVSFPKNYKDTYTEYLSLDRIQNPDQFIRLFANDIAMQGRNEKGELPTGSVLVAEVYSVKKNEDGSVKNTMLNRRIQDKLLLVAIMEKYASKINEQPAHLHTGQWEFGAYKPDGNVAPKNLDECRACHAPLGANDYIFSGEHLP